MRKIIAISVLAYGCLTKQNDDAYQPNSRLRNDFRNRRQDHYRKIDQLHNSLNQKFNELFQNLSQNKGVLLRDNLRSNLGNRDFKADPRFKNRLFGRGIHDKAVQIVPEINERVNRFKEVSIEENGNVIGRGFGQYHEGQLPVIVRTQSMSAGSSSLDASNQSNSNSNRAGSSRSQQKIARPKSDSQGSKAGIFSHRFKKQAVQNSRQTINAEFTDPSQQSYVQVNIRQENSDSNQDKQASIRQENSDSNQNKQVSIRQENSDSNQNKQVNIQQEKSDSNQDKREPLQFNY